MRAKLKRWSILTHRYLGVGFCVLFLLWFVSGVVMMYRDYPSVKPEQRLGRLEALNAAQIQLTPAEALRRSGLAAPPQRVRLTMLEGRPVYRFHGPQRTQVAVYADDGAVIATVPEDLARKAAARLASLPAARGGLAGTLDEPDQWTLNKIVRPLKPFYKFAFDDEARTEVYVSARTGEPMQFTQAADRFWGYLGAVIHWWYFTPLRKHTDVWRAVIIGFSLVGTLMSLFGIVVGLWLYSPSKRYKLRDAGPTSIPYAGWKRWHTIVGLFFGLTTSTWILSGMFSMNPFQWSPERDIAPAVQKQFTGGAVELRAFTLPLALDGDEKEVEFVQFQGKPLMLATRSHPHDTELRFIDGGRLPQLTREPLVDAARQAMPGVRVEQVEWLTEYDAYYTDRHGEKRLPMLRVRFADEAKTWLHIDPYSARLFESYVTTSRVERWLYHGLHSLDFPLLYKYRPAWDIVVLLLMAGGTALCVTSVWIGWKRLLKGVRDLRRRPARGRVAAPVAQPVPSGD